MEFHFQLPDSNENIICSKCQEYLIALEQFSERCINVNTMFDIILSLNEAMQIDSIYLQGLRDEAGLDKDDVSIWRIQ